MCWELCSKQLSKKSQSLAKTSLIRSGVIVYVFLFKTASLIHNSSGFSFSIRLPHHE